MRRCGRERLVNMVIALKGAPEWNELVKKVGLFRMGFVTSTDNQRIVIFGMFLADRGSTNLINYA